jgi:hypothetical protein
MSIRYPHPVTAVRLAGTPQIVGHGVRVARPLHDDETLRQVGESCSVGPAPRSG